MKKRDLKNRLLNETEARVAWQKECLRICRLFDTRPFVSPRLAYPDADTAEAKQAEIDARQAEIDAMRPVVEAAEAWIDIPGAVRASRLRGAVVKYRRPDEPDIDNGIPIRPGDVWRHRFLRLGERVVLERSYDGWRMDTNPFTEVPVYMMDHALDLWTFVRRGGDLA